MTENVALFILGVIESECRKAHMDTEAEAVAFGMSAILAVSEMRKEKQNDSD